MDFDVTKIENKKDFEAYTEGLINGLEETSINIIVHKLEAEGRPLPDGAQPCNWGEMRRFAELAVYRAIGFLAGVKRMQSVPSEAIKRFA